MNVRPQVESHHRQSSNPAELRPPNSNSNCLCQQVVPRNEQEASHSPEIALVQVYQMPNLACCRRHHRRMGPLAAEIAGPSMDLSRTTEGSHYWCLPAGIAS